MTPPRAISVADAKRRFSDVLGAVRYRQERFVIERNGTPMAALVPLEDLAGAADTARRPGFLALVGAFADAPEYSEVALETVRRRRAQRSRRAPSLTG